MRKFIALILAILIVMSMAISASAVTPPLRVPSIKIPDISGSVKIDTTPAVDAWFDEHPIRIDWTRFDFSRWFR